MHGMYNIKIKENCFIQNVFSAFQTALPYSFTHQPSCHDLLVFILNISALLLHSNWMIKNKAFKYVFAQCQCFNICGFKLHTSIGVANNLCMHEKGR
jgi:hypothetical protein